MTADSTDALAVTGPRASRSLRVSRWLVTRLLLGIGTLFGVSIVVFAATQALPGDVAQVILGTHATPERIEQLREQLGLDLPLITQYWRWLSGILTGDLGTSLVNHVPVGKLLGGRILNSLTLGFVAMAFTIPLSLLVGIRAASRRDRWFDKAFMGTSMITNSMPDFILGTLLIVLFCTNALHLLPAVSIIPPGDVPWQHLSALVLPVMTLTLVGVTYLGRLVRASVIDVMESEYVQAAVLKGLPTKRILLRHVLPNAIAPVVPAASIVAAFMLAGLVVIEYLFTYPGLGSALVDAVSNHDLPVVQAIVLLMAAVFFLFNQLADVFSSLQTTGPRV